jgi:hypothetical protein
MVAKRLAIPSVVFLKGQIGLACKTAERRVHRIWRNSFAVLIFLSAGTAVAQGYLGDVAIEGNDVALSLVVSTDYRSTWLVTWSRWADA